MKSTKYILLVIGILGVFASIYNAIVDTEMILNISSFIASASLVYLGLYKVVPIPEKECTE